MFGGEVRFPSDGGGMGNAKVDYVGKCYMGFRSSWGCTKWDETIISSAPLKRRSQGHVVADSTS